MSDSDDSLLGSINVGVDVSKIAKKLGLPIDLYLSFFDGKTVSSVRVSGRHRGMVVSKAFRKRKKRK
jgi:hypothetical protein